MRHYAELCHDNVCKPALFQCHFSCLNVGKLLVWKGLDSSKTLYLSAFQTLMNVLLWQTYSIFIISYYLFFYPTHVGNPTRFTNNLPTLISRFIIILFLLQPPGNVDYPHSILLHFFVFCSCYYHFRISFFD